jgi:hypothetical protein
MILTINVQYVPKYCYLVGPSNEDGLCYREVTAQSLYMS